MHKNNKEETTLNLDLKKRAQAGQSPNAAAHVTIGTKAQDATEVDERTTTERNHQTDGAGETLILSNNGASNGPPSREHTATINQKIKQLLRDGGAQFRTLLHDSAGLSEEVASVRGSSLQQGAKALLFKVKIPTREPRYVLAVVGSNRRVNPRKVASVVGGKSARLAERSLTEKLTGCKIGAIPPFTFSDDYTVVVDRSLTQEEEIVFNAGLLTESIFLNTGDYLELVNPTMANLTD